jgi:hypothetical protein
MAPWPPTVEESNPGIRPSRQRDCIECGESWHYSEKFEARLRDKFGENYNPPKRCFDCRQKRREQNAARPGDSSARPNP